MAQPNRSTSFVAVAASAAVVAVVSIDYLAVAVQNYYSLARFLKTFLGCSSLFPFAPLFPMCAPAPELHPQQEVAQEKNIFWENNIFLQGVFSETLRHLFIAFFHALGSMGSSAVVQLHQEPLLLLQDL